MAAAIFHRVDGISSWGLAGWAARLAGAAADGSEEDEGGEAE